MRGDWRNVAEKAAAAYCRNGTPPGDTIKKHATEMSKAQIRRACETANHRINSELLKSGSRYPKFPLADSEKIQPMRKKATAPAVSIRRVGSYQAGDELADRYEALFDEKTASTKELPELEKFSQVALNLFVREVDNQLGGELILAQDAVEKKAEDFVTELQSTMWDTPPEVILRAVVDTADDVITKTWALRKVAACAAEMGEVFSEDGDIPANYNKEAGLVPVYAELEEAFTHLRDLEKECDYVMSKLSGLNPDNAIDRFSELAVTPLAKLAFLGGMLGKAFGSVAGVGMGAAMMAPSMMGPSGQINAAKQQYDAAGFGRPPAAPAIAGTF